MSDSTNTAAQGSPQGAKPFQLGLTLAGAISAGAYTAGVLDYLVEALEAWAAAKEAGDQGAPKHEVAISVISGASAGAITGAILGACLGHQFPHRRWMDSGDGSSNPLFDSWVNRVSIEGLLGTEDLKTGAPAQSILDSTLLDGIAKRAIEYGANLPRITRSYLANPVRFIFTVTNLRGVPYAYYLEGSNYPQVMILHGDEMRFALSGIGTQAATSIRANEYALSYPAGGSKWGGLWQTFGWSALASGAFPVGLAPRVLERARSYYQRRPVVVPGSADRDSDVRYIDPAWDVVGETGTDPYSFVNVDGGVINNEPFDLARIELAGGDPLGSNPRDGNVADRAVIMVDPFAGSVKRGPKDLSEATLLKSIFATFDAAKDQSRFRPEDVALARDFNVYSRYMIAPERPDRVSGDSATSIACGSLGGFGGFLHIAFRKHDYQLGRANCQKFLASNLTLPENSALFDGWTTIQRDHYAVVNEAGVRELPIVPLMPALYPTSGTLEPMPDWPIGKFDPESLRPLIKQRADALVDNAIKEVTILQQFLGSIFKLGYRWYMRGKLTDFVINEVTKDLKQHGLLR